MRRWRRSTGWPARSVGHNLDRPIEVGDPDKDPIHLEISLCGPKHVAVYAEIAGDVEPTDEVKISPNGLCLHHGQHKVLLMCYRGVGFGRRLGRRNNHRRRAALQRELSRIERSRGCWCCNGS